MQRRFVWVGEPFYCAGLFYQTVKDCLRDVVFTIPQESWICDDYWHEQFIDIIDGQKVLVIKKIVRQK